MVGESLSKPIDPALDQTSDLQPIFSDCLDNVVEIVGSRPTSSIYLVDEAQGELVLGMQRGVLETAEGRRGRTKLDESWMGLVARQGEPRLIDDLGTDAEISEWSRDIGLFRSAMIVPLKSQKQIIGIVSVLDLAPRAFDADTGTFTFSGLDPAILISELVAMDLGSFTFSGLSADITRQTRVDMDAGSFTFSGLDSAITLAAAGGETHPHLSLSLRKLHG